MMRVIAQNLAFFGFCGSSWMIKLLLMLMKLENNIRKGKILNISYVELQRIVILVKRKAY